MPHVDSMRSVATRSVATFLAVVCLTGTSAASAATAGSAPMSWCASRCDELVVDWNATAYQVIKAADGYRDPLFASRALAMMHLAMHDAANAARPRYTLYVAMDRDPQADPAIAAVAAAHEVLAALYPGQRETLLQPALDKSLFDAGNGHDVVRGIALGKRAAAAILTRRAGDGASRTVEYRQGSGPGEYRFTAGFDFAAHPHWRSVTPFSLESPSQFRVAPPPPLVSAAYAAAFNEVKRAGGKRDARRTLDETRYAAFWYEFSDIGWNRIARVVSRQQPQDLWQRARTFALLNVVMADAYIAGWDSKFYYNFWRPATAIHLADIDGNPATSRDESFEPFMVTPPVQDHPSTHSALGAAAAAVLVESFGNVRFRFASTTALADQPTREFASFEEAARENADSRVKAGLHFRFATVEGLALGQRVGRFALSRYLTPLD
jgi:hypothetical protein